MIDFERKFVFIHITRTGGSSVERALGGKLQDHRKPRMYQREYGENIFNDLFTFTVARNPWDKIVSHYCYQRSHLKNNIEESHPIKDMTFTKYVSALAKGMKLCNFDMHQHNWLVDQGGKVVIDRVLRFENLQADFNAVCERLWGKRPPKLPHKNYTRRAHYSVYYDNHTRDIVGNIFKKDIDLFDYKFDN